MLGQLTDKGEKQVGGGRTFFFFPRFFFSFSDSV
jgi:hypothetical protein